MKMKNTGDRTYTLEIGGMPGQAPTVYEIKPGDVCDLPAGYCTAAFLEGHAPKLKPHVEEEAPPAPTPASEDAPAKRGRPPKAPE
jgi:hypothetical protein